jgi:hypothetical protein
VVAGPRGEGRSSAGAAIREVLAGQSGERAIEGRERLGIGLANRPLVRDEFQPRQVPEDRAVEGHARPLPVVVLDPEEDSGIGIAGRTPHPERIRDVSRVEESGRRRCEPRPAAGGTTGDAVRSPDVRRRRRRDSVATGRHRPARAVQSEPSRPPLAQAVAPLERSRDHEQPLEDRQQVGLGVGPSFAIDTRRSTSRSRSGSGPPVGRSRPSPGPPPARAGALVEQADDRRSRASIRRRSRRSSAVPGGRRSAMPGPEGAAIASSATR